MATARSLEAGSKKQLVALLPVLEHTWSKDVSGIMTDAGFPPDRIVTLAISEGSNYWCGLAIQWITANYPVSDSLAYVLEQLGRSNVGTQAHRHAAMKRFAQWKKEMPNQSMPHLP